MGIRAFCWLLGFVASATDDQSSLGRALKQPILHICIFVQIQIPTFVLVFSRRKLGTRFMKCPLHPMQMTKLHFIILSRNFVGANSNVVNARIFFCKELNHRWSSRNNIGGYVRAPLLFIDLVQMGPTNPRGYPNAP